MSKSAPSTTIVMRSKNSEAVIGQALAALFSQQFTDFEVLVVDSGSTDRTLQILAPYPHELVRIPAADYFPGRVLNDAIAKTRTATIVFQNSDAVPLSPHSLGNLVRAFDDPDVQAAFGRQLPRPEAHPWVRREYEQSFPDADKTPPWITLSLPWAAMRRTAWERHPFWTDAWASEDTEWGQWARDHGMAIRYVREAIAMHSHNYTLRQLYSRRFVEGEADAFIYRREHSRLGAVLHVFGLALRDVGLCLRQKEWTSASRAPMRGVVYGFGYLRGHEHGVRRLRAGGGDATLGQRTVLSGHDSTRF